VGALAIFYAGSGKELKHMEMGQIMLPWGRFFFTNAASLRPALLLERPGLERTAEGLGVL
jgi:hypothetical protein